MKLYSNEIVFRGHPDKVCDQISDAILEECLKSDENSRCGIEVCGGKGKIFVTGEVTTKASINVEKIVKAVLDSVGYDTNYEIINNLGVQSTDIALGTNEEVNGAGDNGMMFGYATNDTEYYLPVSMVILQLFSEAYANLVKEDNRFLPDGKAEITGLYDNDKFNKKINIRKLIIIFGVIIIFFIIPSLGITFTTLPITLSFFIILSSLLLASPLVIKLSPSILIIL